MTDEQVASLTKLYADLRAQFPKSLACVQLPLEFLQGDAFKQNLIAYLKPKITKGEPSLFNTLKHLYNNTDRVKWIEQVFLSFAESLEKTGKYDSGKTVRCLRGTDKVRLTREQNRWRSRLHPCCGSMSTWLNTSTA